MDIVRSNIRHLINGRSVKEVGDESEVGQSWLQRYLNPERPNGIQKANPEKMAQLAAYFGVKVSELMYQDLTNQPVTSQPVGREREIVAAAVKLVEYVRSFAVNQIPSEQYPDMLYVAMQVARDDGPDGILSGATIYEASQRFAARLRAGG